MIDQVVYGLLSMSAVLLGVSAVAVVARLTRGPTMLDRAIAFDVLVAIAICSVGVDAALRRESENLSLLVVATLLGFVGSVSIARFTPGSDEVDAEDPGSPGDPGDRDGADGAGGAGATGRSSADQPSDHESADTGEETPR